jgi:chromosome segregation ATPase
MTSRILILINSIGCVALIGLAVLQWTKERVLHGTLDTARAELAAETARAAEHARQQTALERDIALLKESLTSTQQAAETAARELGEKSTLAATLDTELKTAREQITIWETAIKARDERIATLTTDLAATRKRLDEAIARLNAAAKERKGGN